MTMDTPTTDEAASTAQRQRPTIVKNAASSHFSAVDLTDGTVLADVGSGRYPHTAVFHPELPLAYLVYISSAHMEVLDLERLETIQRIEALGTAPVGSALGANAEYFFVGTAVDLPDSEDPGLIAMSISDDGTVERIGDRPLSRCSGMRIGPEGSLYVGQKYDAGLVKLTADDELAVQTRIETGQKPHDMYVLPDDETIVVNNAAESFATVVDTASETAVTSVETGENPHGFGIAEGPDYRYGLFPAREGDRVSIVDLDEAVAGVEEPTTTLLDVGTATGFVGATPNGRYALFDSYDESFVTIVDLASKDVVGRVEIGGEPLHVVFNDDGTACYVGNMERSEIAVLDTAPLLDERPDDVTVERRIDGLGKKPSGIFRPEVAE
jgi:DNA-binding beta-propeller fold protein YncE